jgi:nitrous oxide reductase
MNYSPAPQSKLQFNRRQILTGSILIGVGGVVWLAGAALAGTALAMAFRQRVQQMDVPPTELARQHWSAVKHATSAGKDVWLKEQPITQFQSAANH